MSDLTNIADSIKKSLAPLAQRELGDLAHGFLSDAESFLSETKEDLASWSEQLAKGTMSVDGFELAVRGRAAVFRMKALTEAGINQVKLDRLKAALVGAVVSTIRETLRV